MYAYTLHALRKGISFPISYISYAMKYYSFTKYEEENKNALSELQIKEG